MMKIHPENRSLSRPRQRRVRMIALVAAVLSAPLIAATPIGYGIATLVDQIRLMQPSTSLRWLGLGAIYACILGSILAVPSLAVLCWESLRFRRPESCFFRWGFRVACGAALCWPLWFILRMTGTANWPGRDGSWLMIAQGALLSIAITFLLLRVRIRSRGTRIVGALAALGAGFLSLPSTTLFQIAERFDVGLNHGVINTCSFLLFPAFAMIPPTLRRMERRALLASGTDWSRQPENVELDCPRCGSHVCDEHSRLVCRGCGVTIEVQLELRSCPHGQPVARGIHECAACLRTEDRLYAAAR
jgi:hypothetical protein